MECKYCRSMWNSIIKVESCPFCGNNLLERETYTISSALEKIIADKGIGILNNPDMLMKYVMDYVKGDDKNKKLLQIAANEGIFKLMFEAKNGKIKQEKLKEKAVKVLEEDAFLSTENAVHIIEIIAEGLSLESGSAEIHQNFEDVNAEVLQNIVKKNLKCTNEECEEIFLIGRKKLGNKEEKEAIDYIRYAAKHGCTKADFLLGYCYEKGIAISQDVKVAEAYYRQGIISDKDYKKYYITGRWGGKYWSPEADIKAAEEGEALYLRSQFM